MSPPLISRNADLSRLEADGYAIEVRDGFLIVREVPYVTAAKEVKFGSLISALTLAGERSVKPKTHVIYFSGEYPCHADGSAIAQLQHSSRRHVLAEGLVADHSFSNKPAGGYADQYEKVTNYVRIISSPAEALNKSVTARAFAGASKVSDESVFQYVDTNASSAEIVAIAGRLRGLRIGIVGLGGTGGYILDLVAKTPVGEIHLYDGDRLFNHNAFRAPGAAAREELAEAPFKTDYFKKIYERMHRGIQSHARYIDQESVDELARLDFVFICIDDGDARKLIFARLGLTEIPFVDVGMGVEIVDEKLRGIVRTTTSTRSMRDHVRARVSFSDRSDDVYDTNVQIAELNMLNASFAVVRWKKLFGVYDDLTRERNATYTIDVNMLVSDDSEA